MVRLRGANADVSVGQRTDGTHLTVRVGLDVLRVRAVSVLDVLLQQLRSGRMSPTCEAPGSVWLSACGKLATHLARHAHEPSGHSLYCARHVRAARNLPPGSAFRLVATWTLRQWQRTVTEQRRAAGLEQPDAGSWWRDGPTSS